MCSRQLRLQTTVSYIFLMQWRAYAGQVLPLLTQIPPRARVTKRNGLRAKQLLTQIPPASGVRGASASVV